MLNKKNLLKVIRHPGLALVLIRRWFPWAAVRHDPECRHLISAWSCGQLRRIKVTDLFPGIEAANVVLRKPESRIIGWSLDLQELVHLVSIVKIKKTRRILEIGTFDGFTALNLAANIDSDGEVCTLDLPQTLDQEAPLAIGISNARVSGSTGSKFRFEPEAQRIRQFFGNSAVDDWKMFGLPFDLILVDGSHDFSYVWSDSVNAIKASRDGGVILWHDYGQSVDVSRAVDELARNYPIHAIVGTRFACLIKPATISKQ